MKNAILISWVFSLMFVGTVSATIINVPTDQSNIQAGINISSNGDTVRVESGIYYENINFSGKNIVVGSWFLDDGDPSFISSTIIDGNQSGTVVYFLNAEDNSAVITGFTIQNGIAMSYGGGICCRNNSSPTISNNTISGNSAYTGGGIVCTGSNPTIDYNTISGNSATLGGGGIYCAGSSPTISNNSISANSASYAGGIACAYCSPEIANNTISGNSATQGGGGISCYDSNPPISNTIFWGDSAPNGPEIYLYGTSSPVITYCDVEGGWAGETNIDCDPMFCDPENGNFYLDAASCCVGAGESGVDIGAFGVGCGEDIPTLFCDDFEDGIITDWQILRDDGCEWTEADGVFSTSISGAEKWCIQTVGDHNWGNYIFEGLVKGNSGVDKVFVFRIQDEDNFYAVNLRSDYPSPGIDEVTFDKMVDGVYNADLVTASHPSENGVWYHLKIICADNTFTVFVNGNQVIEYTDNENVYYTGGIGVACWTGIHGACGISFDNVKITDPFPHIVFDEVVGANVGDFITISGHVESWDGSVFDPLAPGTIGCEDPVSLMSRIVDVDETGVFSIVTNQAVEYPALYDFKFGANYDGNLIRKHLFVPVSANSQQNNPELFSGLSAEMGPMTRIPRTNKGISVQFPLVTSWEILSDAAVSLFYGFPKTHWQKVTGSPTGKVITSVRDWTFADCEWDVSTSNHCFVGVLLLGVQFVQYSQPLGILCSGFEEVWTALDGNGLTHEQVQWLNTACQAVNIAYGLSELTADKNIIEGVAAAQDFLDHTISNIKILYKRESQRDNVVTDILVYVTDEEDNVYFFTLFPIQRNVSTITSWSPVDLVVTNPEGHMVSKTVNEIEGADYIEYDFDGDGEPEDQIIIPDSVFGTYQIEVIPDETALPTDIFSLYFENSYLTDRVTLAEDTPISEIPPTPYEVETFENLPPDPFSLLEPNGTVYESLPITFSWNSTSDPNPDHSVFYDLIISTDNAFTDSLVVYDIIEASYVFTGSLPVDDQDNEYFWGIRAHDLWGESTFSNETFSFFYVPQDIPTLSEWGMIILALLLLASGTVAVIRRRRGVITGSKWARSPRQWRTGPAPSRKTSPTLGGTTLRQDPTDIPTFQPYRP